VTLSSDRRKNSRYHFETIILHDTLLPDIFYDAKMYDIGKGGVYFESDQSLYPREEIYIGLKGGPYSENTEKYFSYVRIKWRKDLTNGSFKFGYGAEFIKASESLLKILDVAGFGNELPKNKTFQKEKDPREHQRNSYRKVVHFFSRNSKSKGYVKNISRGGAFIITREKFAIGQILNLVFPATRLKKELRLKGRIVRVDENGVGIRFDRRSGKDRRADLDRRRKVIDRRRNKVKKSGARRKTSGNPVKFASLAPKETPTQKPPSG
jgi:Tfp pilus assembly protein PilZ